MIEKRKLRLGRTGKAILHLLRLAGFALAVSVLLILFALLVVGLPDSLTRQINDRIVSQGIPLRFDSIRLSPHRGWVLGNARLYSTSPDDLKPLLQTKKLYVRAWPETWTDLPRTDWHIKLYAKHTKVSLGRYWETALPPNHPFCIANRIKISLTAGRKQVAVHSAEIYWGTICFHTQGTVDIATRSKRSSRSANKKLVIEKIAETVNQLGHLHFEETPQVSINFSLNTAHPEQSILTMDLSAENPSWKGHSYRHLSGRLDFRDRTLSLSALTLAQSESRQLVINGIFNSNNSNTLLSVENSLPIQDLFALLPAPAQAMWSCTDIQPTGTLDFTASLGPAPLRQLVRNIDVQVQQVQIHRKDLTLDPFTCRILRNGDLVDVRNIQTKANGDPVSGNFQIDLVSKVWKTDVQGQCDPALIGSITGGGLQKFLSRFSFPAEQPKMNLQISQNGRGKTLHISGTLAADQFTCGGVPVDHFDSDLTYSNHVVVLDSLHASHDKKRFDGDVQVDLSRELGFFKASSSFAPSEIAHALAPDKSTILDEFLFDSPPAMTGSGQIDYGTWTNNRFSGTFHADDVRIKNIHTGSFDATIEGSGPQLLFTNTVIHFCDGLVDGQAQFDLCIKDGSAPYRFNARLAQIDFAQLLKQVSSNRHERTSGTLSGTLRLSADGKAGFWNSVQGGGQVNIEKGLLADLPIFGGFSRLVQSSFPAFKLFSLTSFSADYELRDGAVASDNAQLGGTLLSASGRGTYSPQTGLDFIVTAEPLRQTNSEKAWYQLHLWLADIVKEGTAPLFRFLEFKLEGSLNNPRWQFVNLPKEVSELLQRNKKSKLPDPKN